MLSYVWKYYFPAIMLKLLKLNMTTKINEENAYFKSIFLKLYTITPTQPTVYIIHF